MIVGLSFNRESNKMLCLIPLCGVSNHIHIMIAIQYFKEISCTLICDNGQGHSSKERQLNYFWLAIGQFEAIMLFQPELFAHIYSEIFAVAVWSKDIVLKYLRIEMVLFALLDHRNRKNLLCQRKIWSRSN